jgi:putative FmdB family regulatory protein
MPTYEFRCPDGHEFERFYRKMSDATPEVACPECGKLASRLLSGGAGLVFKGSGFYLTDYGKNAHRGTDPSASGSKGGEAKGDGAGEAKSGSTTAESKGSEAKSSDKKPAESKPAESKPAESKPAESKSSGSKSSESKSSETKSSSSTKSDK